MLGLYVPPKYLEDFADLADYFVVPIDQAYAMESWGTTYPTILDATTNYEAWDVLKILETLKPKYLILPPRPRPEDHIRWTSELVTHFRREAPDLCLIAHWYGHARILDMLLDYLDAVCLPDTRPRGYYFKKGLFKPRQLWYYGASSLDQIRVTHPKGLIANLPIAAALRGIDIASRERRPKLLDLFPWDTKLTKDQIRLARANARHLKEALEWDEMP